MVRIRMKSFGRRHRPFFRICAMDARTPRDGKSIEELGHYDPMVRNLEARAVLNVDRIRYWLSVGAQPSEKVDGDPQASRREEARQRRALGSSRRPKHPQPHPRRRHPPRPPRSKFA